jgi:hypothetical protein
MLTYITEPATGQTYTVRYRTAKEETRALHNLKQSFYRASKGSSGSSVSIVAGWGTDDSDFAPVRELITVFATALRPSLRSCETQICTFIVYFMSVAQPPLWSSGQSSWLHNEDKLCFLWGTNRIYICCVEESRPPLWSSGQSYSLHNGDLLCFLWGTNWIYMLCRRK